MNQRIHEPHRGTYTGLGSHEAINYMKVLGIIAVELLPIHLHSNDRYLQERGLTNYWGYNTMGFFSPDPRYASTDKPTEIVREFKTMVRNLHDADIEIILDVVYNHTFEGNELGPTTSFRGIDNAAYYRLSPENHRYYVDYTGCGNTLNVRNPRVLQLIMDSLRYWVTHMHVDGFTLNDLVSYDHKHNEANGEDNRDGADRNDSWNCGAEGPTDDESVNALRAKTQRAILATLLLSQGVSMLLAGDEFGHTQKGNNNGYCQDNELMWLSWELD